MDCAKIGRLISSLRKEKGLTQKEVADALCVQSKTVSKWECGLGCPDLSLWSDLSTILGVDMVQLMEGEITPNKADSGNILRTKLYVCPTCNNILSSTGGASVFCCGRKLEPLKIENTESIKVKSEVADTDYYVTFDHQMEKEHYVSFVAYVKCDSILIIRLYPEQSPAFRLPISGKGKLYLYCSKHGLMECKL